MNYVPPAQRRIDAATVLLGNPPQYDLNPIFAQVPPDGWAPQGYQYTLTVQWSNVPVQDLPDITVRAHVHYSWQGNAWVRFGGNAWISGVNNWDTPTPQAVINMTPAAPPDENYHP
ncbi:hypothetical protein [Paraburkholderia kururiensis]|uniref:hypothetical protein n=1 Tax=Paraburkholderia kururiensis TaxID=984307 RepID=UPI0005AAB409|nr:hypothetical protein [Paraburkholderia kururiensis]